MDRRTAVLSLICTAPILTQPAGAAECLYQLAAAVPLPSRVFVLGATGKTGRRVVEQLRALGVAVTAGCRDVRKGESLGLAAQGAKLVKVDVATDSVEAIAAAIGDSAAVVCATGFTPSFNFGVDNAAAVDGAGTRKAVDAAKAAGVKQFILVSSLLTNAPKVGQAENPNYKFLNALGGILDEKRNAEMYLAASGLAFTVVRPGGLSDEPPAAVGGSLVIQGEDTLYGLPGDPGREISRDLVATVCVQALLDDDSANRIVEVLQAAAPVGNEVPKQEWF